MRVRRTNRRAFPSRRRLTTGVGLDLDAVQNWEQGRTRPDRNVRILLEVIATAPEALEEALG